LLVGFGRQGVARLLGNCRVVGTLDNGVAVDNEDQGRLIQVCRGPAQSWAVIWPSFPHYDRRAGRANVTRQWHHRRVMTSQPLRAGGSAVTGGLAVGGLAVGGLAVGGLAVGGAGRRRPW
jgi:hypothetical protein